MYETLQITGINYQLQLVQDFSHQKYDRTKTSFFQLHMMVFHVSLMAMFNVFIVPFFFWQLNRLGQKQLEWLKKDERTRFQHVLGWAKCCYSIFSTGSKVGQGFVDIGARC